MVPCNEIFVPHTVVQGKTENAVHIIHKVHSLFLVEGQNHLTIGLCLEFVFSLKLFSQFPMVVYFPVRGQNKSAIGTQQWLFTRSRINNCQSLMGQYRTIIGMDATPIRATVPNFFGHFQNAGPECLTGLLQIKCTNNSTHLYY